jgi:hypothetical protein
MDEYAARADGLEALQRSLHPILLFERKENALVRLCPDNGTQQVTNCGLVGLMCEISLQHPGPAILRLEGGNSRLGRIEDLADHVGHDAC